MGPHQGRVGDGEQRRWRRLRRKNPLRFPGGVWMSMSAVLNHGFRTSVLNRGLLPWTLYQNLQILSLSSILILNFIKLTYLPKGRSSKRILVCTSPPPWERDGVGSISSRVFKSGFLTQVIVISVRVNIYWVATLCQIPRVSYLCNIILFNLYRDTEAQKGHVLCPRSHSR